MRNLHIKENGTLCEQTLLQKSKVRTIFVPENSRNEKEFQQSTSSLRLKNTLRTAIYCKTTLPVFVLALAALFFKWHYTTGFAETVQNLLLGRNFPAFGLSIPSAQVSPEDRSRWSLTVKKHSKEKYSLSPTASTPRLQASGAAAVGKVQEKTGSRRIRKPGSDAYRGGVEIAQPLQPRVCFRFRLSVGCKNPVPIIEIVLP